MTLLGNLSYTELSQVMVDVFVHEDCPLLWFERPEKGMWVLGTASCTHISKAADRFEQFGAFALEIALCGVRREEFRRGGRVAAYWFVVTEDEWLDKQADDFDRKGGTFGVGRAHRHLQTRGTVREHKGEGQFAPEPLTLGMEAHDPLLHLSYQRGVKEIFHGSWPWYSRWSLLTSLSICPISAVSKKRLEQLRAHTDRLLPKI